MMRKEETWSSFVGQPQRNFVGENLDSIDWKKKKKGK